MDRFPVVVRYDGTWNDELKFVGYKNSGLAVSFSQGFGEFKKNLLQSLKIDVKREDLKIEFQVSDGELPMEINSDDLFQFFMACKQQSNKVSDYPLCVTRTSLDLCFDEGSDFDETILTAIDFGQIGEQRDVDVASSSTSAIPEPINSIDPHSLYIETISNDVMKEMDCDTENDSTNEEDEDTELSEARINSIYVGQVFKDRDVCKRAVAFFAIKNGFKVSAYKSCPKQYYLRCRIKGCDWNFRASCRKNNGLFVVRHYQPEHTCNLDLRNNSKPQASTSIIAEQVKRAFHRLERVYKAGDIIDDVRNELGAHISYQKAWRSREQALKYIRGTTEESYGYLPSMIYMVEQTNPGSVISLEVDAASRFKYLFLALKACIEGWPHCRPVVVVDATFLKTKYNGTLISACGYDASERLFPLAFAVVDGENDDSWEWFLRQFKAAFGERQGLVIVSDRHASIEKGCSEVFPGIMHGICTYHLLQNLKAKFRKKSAEIAKYFKRAAYSYTISNFEKNMTILANINPEIVKYLVDADVGKWSRAHSSTNRYSAMTSNNAESLNAMTLAAKCLPISSLVAYLRNLLQKRFKKNRDIARKTKTELTTRFYNLLQKKYQIASRMEVVSSTDDLVTVRRNAIEHVVNMQEKTCTCRRFQVDEIPCAHALAYIRDRKLMSTDYISPYFTTEKMLDSYAATIFPMPSRDQWQIPESIMCRVVLPPEVVARVGRPRKRRIRQHWEQARKHVVHCSNCGEANHNRKTCPGPKA